MSIIEIEVVIFKKGANHELPILKTIHNICNIEYLLKQCISISYCRER